MQRHPKVRARVASLAPEDRMVICTIVRGEVLYGLERTPQGKRRRDLEAKAVSLFAAIPCEPILEAVGDSYARIKRTAERKGNPCGSNGSGIISLIPFLLGTIRKAKKTLWLRSAQKPIPSKT